MVALICIFTHSVVKSCCNVFYTALIQQLERYAPPFLPFIHIMNKQAEPFYPFLHINLSGSFYVWTAANQIPIKYSHFFAW